MGKPCLAGCLTTGVHPSLDPSKASDKQTVKNFCRKVLRELVKIKVA